MLQDITSRYLNASNAGDIVSIGAFLGKKFHKLLLTKIGSYTERIAPAKRSIPTSGPKVFFQANSITTKSNNNEHEQDLIK